jgi:phosphatidylserine/phosphatidylglycerophosphate/cardiolipin synthase-like enzyme
MKWALRLIIPLTGLFFSCQGLRIGGTFPGVPEESRDATFQQLARYYPDHTDSTVVPAVGDTDYVARSATFRWDPYNTMRILAPFYYEPTVVQRLFRFDPERLIGRHGNVDLLTALYQSTLDLPFDSKKQIHLRPYRSLAVWGSLGHPPLKSLPAPLSFYHNGFGLQDTSDISLSPFFNPAFQIALDRETQTELTYGNRLQALFNGSQSWPEKVRLASEAKRTLFIAVMAIVADETGRDLIRVLVDRKRAGVDVRVIVDDFYAFSISQYAIGVLEREGIPVAHVADKRLNQLDRMFHCKFWIRDGEEAVLGGMNVLDYENESDGFNFLNRDTDVLVCGPAVTGLTGSFIRLWKRYDKTGTSIAQVESTFVRQYAVERACEVRGAEHYAQWLRNPATRMNGICRTAVQGDGAEPQRIVTLLTRYLQASRHSFYMTSPEVEYDVQSEEPTSIDSLAKVMLGKVRTPGFFAAYVTNGTDGGLGESSAFLRSRIKDSQLAGDPLWEDIMTPLIAREGREVSERVRRVLEPLVEAGLHGYQYFNYVHAKEFYFDRLLVGIGSWNFDLYSAENNHECAIFALDEKLRLQIEHQFVLDMVNSTPVVPASLIRPAE